MSVPSGGFQASLNFAFTSDLGRSVRFYRDVLGLTPVIELDNAAVFHVAGKSYIGVSEKPPRPGGAIQEFVVADRAEVNAWHILLFLRATFRPLLALSRWSRVLLLTL